MPPGETYLDYTGSTLYWNSQLEATFKVRVPLPGRRRSMLASTHIWCSVHQLVHLVSSIRLPLLSQGSAAACCSDHACSASSSMCFRMAAPGHRASTPPLPQDLEAGVYGNPHSENPSSLRTEGRVEALRTRLLEFLGADPDVYDVRAGGRPSAG